LLQYSLDAPSAMLTGDGVARPLWRLTDAGLMSSGRCY